MDFWGEFPEVYQQVLSANQEGRGREGDASCLASDDEGRTPWEIDKSCGDVIWRC